MNENDNQISMRDILQLCRGVIGGLNSNTIVAALREQNVRFDKALNMVEKILPAAERVLDQDIPDVSMKAATIFLISLWSRLKKEISVDKLTKEDWGKILNNALDKAENIDPQDFSLQVFDLYKRSIAYAIEPMRDNASPSVISRLEEIVSLMEEYAENLGSGIMPETKFIEENLWLSLEAVFLVLTDRMNYQLIPEKRRELAEAMEALIFQRFRYSHYEKELAAIDACLEYQAKLDQKLTEQVNAYIDALNEELDTFDALVERAFDTKDFHAAFSGSVNLAKTLGAEEILQTQSDVDDYFLS